MNNTKWIYRPHMDVEELRNLDLDRDTLSILLNRGVATKENIKKFLNPNLDNISDPFSLSDVSKAVGRILLAKEKNESIWIYGDYDVDGITSTSLCYLALKKLDIDVNYYIPLRDEGYGLNNEALSYIKEQGGDLVITVDCGISSIEEVEHANSIGLDMIITDHHEINNVLPPAYSVINPKRDDNEYQFQYLAGVGTAFMLICAIYTKLQRKNEAFDFLDIVATGTVADIVPLLEENRIFVKHGLEMLKKSKNLGLRTLISIIFDDLHEKKFNTYDIGFIIAPVFNAAGRLEDAKKGVKLLLSDSEIEAKQIAWELIQQNNERKDMQAEILEKVELDIEQNSLDSKNVIVSYSSEFHHGIIGIVASKIVDKYYKPTIIMEVKVEEGIAVASARSIENFNIIEALNSMKELFVKYGGHAGAAGFSIKIDNIPQLIKRLNEYAGSRLEQNDFKKPIKIDKELQFSRASYDFYKKLEKLEPFGFGNPTPIFCMKNVKNSRTRLIGKDKTHLMFDIIKDQQELKNCVWFSNGHNLNELIDSKELDIAFKLKMDTYKDRYIPKIFVEDVKSSSEVRNEIKEMLDTYDTKFPLETVVYSRKKLTNFQETKLNFNDEVTLVQGRTLIAYLDRQISHLLKTLKYSHNFKFNVKITEILKKQENYNVHISIDRDYSFDTLTYKKNEIFKEIKKFLIDDFQYTELQKSILSTVFKKGKKTIAVCSAKRGINTVLMNIGIYESLNGGSCLFVGKKQGQPDIIKKYFEFSDSFKPGYSFYVFYKTLPLENELENIENCFIFSEENLEIPGFITIKDGSTIPKNIHIISEEELKNKGSFNYPLYSKKLDKKSRKSIIDNLDKFEKIFATNDILAVI